MLLNFYLNYLIICLILLSIWMVENFAGLMSVIILELSSVVTSVIMQTYIVKYNLPTPREIQSSVNSKSVLKTLKQNYSRPSAAIYTVLIYGARTQQP